MEVWTRIAVAVFAILAAFPAQPQASPDTAEYDVTIVFIGLMTFDRGENPQAGDPVTVLIPDIPKDIKIGTGNPKFHIGHHIAYLLADIETMRDDDPLNDDYDFEDTPHPTDTFHYLPFRGYYISIDEENDVAVLNKPLEYDNKGCGGCPVDDPNGDGDTSDSTNGKLCWLSSMKVITKSAQKRDPGHFARRAPQLSSKKISGRMVLRYGKLNSYVIEPAPKWDFIRADGTKFTQALAQETHWTFRARGVPFVLNMNSIKGGSQRVAFKPTFPAADKPGKLTLVIGHTMPADAGPAETVATPKKDEHYAAYYLFIEGNQGDGPIPEPQASANNCKQFTRKPLLDKLVAEAEAAGRTHTNAFPLPPGNPAPGGLNCSANNWP